MEPKKRYEQQKIRDITTYPSNKWILSLQKLDAGTSLRQSDKKFQLNGHAQ